MEFKSTAPRPTATASAPARRRPLRFGGLAASPPSSAAVSPSQMIGELQCMAAGLSALIYCYSLRGLQRILELEGATHVRGFNPCWQDPFSRGIWDNSKIALGFVLDGRAWLVFRGSDDSLDWDANFRFSKTRDDIHFGFSRCWDGLSRVVDPWLDEVAGVVPALVVTGHSLGGAIGVLAARSISQKGAIGIEAVLTFGAPKVGSKRFVERYNALPSNLQGPQGAVCLRDVTWQTRVRDDIVPKVCPNWMGFRHCGQDAGELEPGSVKSLRYFNATNFTLGPATNSGVVETLIKMLSDWIPYLKLFFYGAEKVKQGGLSHRMIGYQNAFGGALSFRDAIARHDVVIEAIQDPRPKDPPPIALLPPSLMSFAHPGPTRDEFPKESTKGWTLRLTVASILAVALLIVFFAAMLWSIKFLAPEFRPFGFGLIVLLTIGFVQKLRKDLR